MLTLVSFPGALDEPSMSGFCTKAMICLDMAGQPWRPRFTVDSSKAPFGKLPCLETPQGPVADSNLILKWLEAKGAELFPGLDTAGRAQAHALIRMVEENLRYGMMYDRWADPEGWAAFMPIVFGNMPAPLRLVIPGKVRKDIVKGLKWQGLGRMSADARQACFDADLDALTDLLWERSWAVGSQPTAADAAIIPVLSGIDGNLVDTALRRSLRNRKTLMLYLERGRERLYQPLNASLSAAA
jgi:glutathione S-transferase